MKIKILIILAISLLATLAGFSQTANTVSAKVLNATTSIYLRTIRIDSITNDPNLLSNSANMVPTEAAVVAYIKNLARPNVYATNGLSASNDSTIVFGGRLIQNTTFSAATSSLVFDSLTNFSMRLLPSKATALSTDSMVIKDASGKVWVLPVPSGASGVSSVGGLSPLFTSSNTGAVTFTTSNAAANTVFGNFTGSSAIPAFGKVNLASMATGTVNSLIGYDGSGNPVVVSVSTGLSLSSNNLTASGGSGGNFVGRDSVVTITSGASSTVTNGYNIVQFNPSSNLGAYTLTTPATWHTSNDIVVVFGGTITSGNPVVTLTVNVQGGQTSVFASALTSQAFTAGEAIRLKFINGQVYVYRIN